MKCLLLLEEEWVEAVVQLAVSWRPPRVPGLQVRRFEAERDRCYSVLDPDARVAAFARVHRRWLSEWNLEKPFVLAINQFPDLAEKVAAIAIRRSRGRSDEAGELYSASDGCRRGVLSVQPRRCLDADALVPWLHHELAHLADLVDPAFAFSSQEGWVGIGPGAERLVRDRYRVLWDVRVDGALNLRGCATVAGRKERQSQFDHTFAFLSPDRRVSLFEELWTGRLGRHCDLMELAADPRELHLQDRPVPGGLCPLCRCAAFDWQEPSTLSASVRQRIEGEFPQWRVETGMCARCAEVFQATDGIIYPSTVCV